MDRMNKTFRDFLAEMPAKTVVFAFGRFQPPTSGHGLLANLVKKLAQKNKADHVIYVSKTKDSKGNPLPVQKKVKYLRSFFPGVNFKPADASIRTFIEAVKDLSPKYDHLIMIAGSDRVAEYQKLLNKYNGSEFDFKTIQVVSAGERDPDADNVSGMSGTKMRNAAKDGDFKSFKKGVPNSVRDVDARALFNDIRKEYGLEVINEDIKTTFDKIREQFISGDLYQPGNIVHDGEDFYEVLDVRSNYLLLADQDGELKRSWYKDVTLAEEPLLATLDPMLYRWIDKKVHRKEYKKAVEIYIRAIDGDPKVLNILHLDNPPTQSKEYIVSKIASVFSNIRVDSLLSLIKDAFSKSNPIVRKKYAIYEEAEGITDADYLQIEFKGYKTNNFHLAPRAREAFTHSIWSANASENPIALLQAIKLVDKILGVQDKVFKDKNIELTLDQFMSDIEKIVDYLEVLDELEFHEDYLEDIKEYMFRVAFPDNDLESI